jgi:hypothetical protein
MRKSILAVAALGLCAAAAAGQGKNPPRAALESLSFESSSWGKPLSAWTIDSSGRGRHTASRAVPSGGFRDYDLITRSFDAGPSGYRRVEALLRPARAYAGAELPCRMEITDMVYGKVRWQGRGGARQVSFNLGCTSKAVAPLYGGFARADKLVERLAQAGRIVETRQVREGRP